VHRPAALARSHPEPGVALLSEAARDAVGLQRHVEAERREGRPVERFAALVVGHPDHNVVEHVAILSASATRPPQPR